MANELTNVKIGVTPRGGVGIELALPNDKWLLVEPTPEHVREIITALTELADFLEEENETDVQRTNPQVSQ